MPRAARRARTDLADRDDGAGGGIRIRCEGAASPALLLFVLARARHRLGRGIHGGLSDGSESMTEARHERAPGDRPSREMHASAPSEFLVYTIGLFVAALFSFTAFLAAKKKFLLARGGFLRLALLPPAPHGVSLVFFLEHNTPPRSN